MTNKPPITPARFSIDLHKMNAGTVNALCFPYSDAIQSYLRTLKRLLPSGQRDRLSIPYRRLNRAMLATINTLCIGFEWMSDANARQTLFVSPSSDMTLRPNIEDIVYVIRGWAQHWTEMIAGDARFHSGDPDRRLRDEARSQLLASLNGSHGVGWEILSIEDLIESMGATSFKALPSLLASMLHGQSCEIDGYPVTWRRVVDDKGNASVQSQPLLSSGKKQEGYFSYVLSISLQTQASRADPWIFLTPHIRRYADARVTKTNYGHNVSILVGCNRARIDNYPFDSSLVRLSADVPEHNNPMTAEWDDQLARVIGRLGARALKSAGDILADAPGDRNPGIGADEYCVIHSEGMKYEGGDKGDELEAGLQFVDAVNVITSTLALLPMLLPDTPFARDEAINSLVSSTSEKPTPMHTLGDIHVAHSVDPEVYEEREPDRQEARMKLVRALENVVGSNSNLHLHIVTHQESAREAIELGLRQLFYLEPDDALPDVLSVVWHQLSSSDMHLIAPLDRGGIEPRDDWNAFKGQMYRSFQTKMDVWLNFLHARIQPDAGEWNLVLIELPEYRITGQHPMQGIKGAVREACDRVGLLSQMVINPGLRTHPHRRRTEPTYNTMSALNDLLIRQTGALIAPPTELYMAAGLSEQQASQLQVLAIDLHQYTKTNPNILYPTAVILKPDGRFEVIAPGTSVEREGLSVAGPAVGRIFAQQRIRALAPGRQGSNLLSFEADGLQQFVQSILLQIDEPTLVILNAENWRRYDRWPQLRNADLGKENDVLDFSTGNKRGMIVKRSDTRVDNLIGIIRVRSENETPYYVTSGRPWSKMVEERQGRELKDLLHLTGFIDPHVELPHYFSLGGMSVTSKEQNKGEYIEATMVSGDAGSLPSKHAQLVEMVPFFLRLDYEDKWMSLCRIVHMLRISPAWDHANIVRPLPLHLSHTIVDDRVCILDTL